MAIFRWLDQIDKTLVLLIQHDSDHSFWDRVMPVLRDPITWVPLYAFMLYYTIRQDKARAWLFVVLTLLTFGITDSLTTQLMKPLFGRLRPCCDPELHGLLRGLIDCGGMYSMPSSHAANHFGLATFWFYSLQLMGRVPRISGQVKEGVKPAGYAGPSRVRPWKWLWVWAAVICYAQVYVGKHYPSDILVGALVGLLTGIGTAKLYGYAYARLIAGRPLFNYSYRRAAGASPEIGAKAKLGETI